jgi:hypothetical protein
MFPSTSRRSAIERVCVFLLFASAVRNLHRACVLATATSSADCRDAPSARQHRCDDANGQCGRTLALDRMAEPERRGKHRNSTQTKAKHFLTYFRVGLFSATRLSRAATIRRTSSLRNLLDTRYALVGRCCWGWGADAAGLLTVVRRRRKAAFSTSELTLNPDPKLTYALASG